MPATRDRGCVAVRVSVLVCWCQIVCWTHTHARNIPSGAAIAAAVLGALLLVAVVALAVTKGPALLRRKRRCCRLIDCGLKPAAERLHLVTLARTIRYRRLQLLRETKGNEIKSFQHRTTLQQEMGRNGRRGSALATP